MPETDRSKSIRVLLVDDQRMVGEAVRRMLMETMSARCCLRRWSPWIDDYFSLLEFRFF